MLNQYLEVQLINVNVEGCNSFNTSKENSSTPRTCFLVFEGKHALILR
jgi:hypothetical protein